jgi:AraC family transcriptional regulator, transcriptional activator of pobA
MAIGRLKSGRRTSAREPLPILSFVEVERGPRVEVLPFDVEHGALSMPPHGHRFFELIYLERGSGTHFVSGTALPVGPGHLYVIAPGESHDARSIQGARGSFVIFTADALADGLAFLRPRGTPPHLVVPLRERGELAGQIAVLANELREQQLGFVEAARARLTLILVAVARLAASQTKDLTPASRPILGDVFRFIEARYMHPITPIDVARAVQKSPAYLTTLVRRETGRSIGAWILERRMVEARRRLLETEEPVEAIAEALGYESHSYFARRFRSVYGRSPIEVRRSAR